MIRASSHAAGSRPGEAREIVRFEDGWGKPDGLTVDADEHLWICHYGGSRTITGFARTGPSKHRFRSDVAGHQNARSAALN